jgi:AAA domain-containing protein/FaeA-like protein
MSAPDKVLFEAAVEGFMEDGHTRSEAVSLAYANMTNTPNTANIHHTNNTSNDSNTGPGTPSPPVGAVGLLGGANTSPPFPTPPPTPLRAQTNTTNTETGGSPRLTVRERFLLMSVADHVAGKPPTKWVVDGLIPEGLTVFAGASKLGKSFVCLDMAAGIAAGDQVLGGMIPEPGDVLYMALEDTSRRLMERLHMREPDRGDWPWDRLTLVTQDLRDGQPLGDLMLQWIEEVDKPLMVIVDTITRFGGQSQSRSGYSADVDWMSKFHNAAVSNGIALIGVTHTNQMKLEEGDDWFNKISGTTGIVGTADQVMLLDAQRGEPEGLLRYAGRDIEEGALTMRRVGPWWQATDQLRGRRGDRSVSIVDWVIQAGTEVTTREVADQFQMTSDKASVYLGRLVKNGLIRRVRTGVYEAV